jgi:hypothetical protein
MNGKAVLPAALIMEWFAHGAMHNNPGLVLKGVTDFRIFKGVILDPDSRIHIQILAGNLSEENGELSLPIELRQGTVIHAGAGIVLGNEHETGEEKQIRGVSGNYSQSVNEVYGNGRLFHGKALQGITAINGCSEKGISVTASPAPRPSHWIRHPVRTGWITDPMVMDAAFQAMILWSFEHLGAGSLPTHISQYRQFCRGFPKDKTEINIRIDSQGDHEIRARIEFLDNKDRLVACIDGYECVVDTSLNEAFQYNRLVGETQ